MAELLEKRDAGGGSDGGSGGVPGLSGSSLTLHLDEDEAVSDLADSDSEVREHSNSGFGSCCAMMCYAGRFFPCGGTVVRAGPRGEGGTQYHAWP